MYFDDKPIETLSEDSLGRESFSKLLAKTLFNLKSTDTFTVGLYGKWGSGKTSIVNMALQELEHLQEESTDKTIVLHFEPWQFYDSRQLLNQFIIRLANEFYNKKDKALNNIGKALQEYAGAFSFAELIPVAGAPIATFGKGFLSGLGKQMQNDITEKDVLQQKAQVINLLKKQKTKILVVIDDIDRLSSEQIRQVFQLVSSVAKFPNTAYLLVFDKEIVVKALNKVQEGNGEEYLHKIIQMPIQIPDVNETELHKTLFKHLDRIIEEYKTPFRAERWKSLFIPCVSPFITNLRDVNRLLNSLQFKLTTISNEIEFSDMVAICAIEIGAPEIFEWIKNHKNILVGDPDVGSFSTYKYTQKDWLNLYTNEFSPLINDRIQVKGYAKNKVETILNALSYLFPAFGGKVGKGISSISIELARKNCYICNTDKFNRYFDLDINGIFITKSQIEKVVFSYCLEELELYLIEKNSEGVAYELLEEIRAMLLDIPLARRKTIFSALMNTMHNLDSKNSHNLLGCSTHTLAEYLTFDILNSVEAEERCSFFITSLNDSSFISIEAFAELINMVELAYGRLAADGVERTEIEKSFSLSELAMVETAFVQRSKIVFANYHLLELPKWRMTLHLLKSFDREFIDGYMFEAMKNDKNIVTYILDLSFSWVGNDVSYEIKKPPYDYVKKEEIVKAIENLISSQELFDLSEDVQEKAAAFYLESQSKTNYRGHITQKDAFAFLEDKKVK